MSRAEVTKLCSRWGLDPLLVQAAGGNVSWKDGDVMWIKASGTWLADACKREIFVAIGLTKLRAALAQFQFDAQTKSTCAGGLRPSIETALHALMPQRIVVHLHHVDALARLVRAEGGDTLAKVLSCGLHAVEVPYRKPGADLARAVSQALQAKYQANVILMRNHGIVVGGKDVSEVEARMRILNDALKNPLMDYVNTSSIPPEAPSGWQPVIDVEVHALAKNKGLFERVLNDWALYPDHVVFLGPVAQCVSCVNDLSNLSEATDLGFVRGSGVYVRPTFSLAKLAQLRCYFDVLMRQPPDEALECLTSSDVAALMDWDAEKYRQTLSKPT
jgi:rhamnose utilization protein RhaD (predicted bifunctional aldolase and dehydrogenase)